MAKIDGKELAKKIIENLKSKPKPKKFLAAILVGDNPTSFSFLKQKEKTAKELGVDFRTYQFPKNIKNDELRREINRIANQKPVGGIIVQLPLPEHLNKYYILNPIPREKDVDVLGERALGAFYSGRNPILPPAVETLQEIIENCKLKIENLRVAIVGLGFLVGKPIAVWLMNKCSEIYLLDKGSDFKILKNADLIITGVGQPGLIKPEMLKNNAGIIDFGYSVKEIKNEKGKSEIEIKGDFDPSLISHLSSLLFYTPTPGGTGPILVAKIFENFYKLCGN
jgi:5,10-methylene-tetrahydrofolate dehydrogenase/methenyl tetrahydrofolate cyclohydrolase